MNNVVDISPRPKELGDCNNFLLITIRKDICGAHVPPGKRGPRKSGRGRTAHIEKESRCNLVVLPSVSCIHNLGGEGNLESCWGVKVNNLPKPQAMQIRPHRFTWKNASLKFCSRVLVLDYANILFNFCSRMIIRCLCMLVDLFKRDSWVAVEQRIRIENRMNTLCSRFSNSCAEIWISWGITKRFLWHDICH